MLARGKLATFDGGKLSEPGSNIQLNLLPVEPETTFIVDGAITKSRCHLYLRIKHSKKFNLLLEMEHTTMID